MTPGAVLNTSDVYLDEIVLSRHQGSALRFGIIEAPLPPGASADRSTWGIAVRLPGADTATALERARYEWLRALGFNVHSMSEIHKILFMVRALEIEYLKPAVLDDLLQVSVAVTEVGGSRIALLQEITCSHVKLVNATVQVVCVGAETLKPTRIPAPLREKIRKVA